MVVEHGYVSPCALLGHGLVGVGVVVRRWQAMIAAVVDNQTFLPVDLPVPALLCHTHAGAKEGH